MTSNKNSFNEIFSRFINKNKLELVFDGQRYSVIQKSDDELEEILEVSTSWVSVIE